MLSYILFFYTLHIFFYLYNQIMSLVYVQEMPEG